MHLHDRLRHAAAALPPVEPRYCVVFKDQDRTNVMTPSSNWLAAALHGSVLPPVECYLRDAEKGEGERPEHPYADPIGPMTEEEAMEYLIQMAVPPAIWRDYRGNERVLAIVRADQVPTDKTYRDAWEIAQ